MTLIWPAGPGLARVGAAIEEVHGGLYYDVSQVWLAARTRHPIGAYGIAYYAQHDDTAPCYALYERTSNAIIEDERRTDLDQDWFWRLSKRYGVGLLP